MSQTLGIKVAIPVNCPRRLDWPEFGTGKLKTQPFVPGRGGPHAEGGGIVPETVPEKVWSAFLSLGSDVLGAAMDSAAEQARSIAVARRRCDRKRF